MHVHIRQTFSSSGQSTPQEIEGITAGRAFLSRLSSPLGDMRELWTMKRECLFANRQHIPSLCYITSTSSVVKDKNHILLYYFKTGRFIYSGFHKASANYQQAEFSGRMQSPQLMHLICWHSSCCSKSPAIQHLYFKTSKKKPYTTFLSFKCPTLSS